jgi:hypothetical protein
LGIGGLLSNSRGARTQTSSPLANPAYAGIGDLLRHRALSRLSNPVDTAGLEASGIQNINNAFKGASDSLNADLTSRGLGTSPAATPALSQLQAARGGAIANLENQMPLIQRDLENQDFAQANQLYQQSMGQQSTLPGSAAGGALGSMAGLLGELSVTHGIGGSQLQNLLKQLGDGSGNTGLSAIQSLLNGRTAPTFGASIGDMLPENTDLLNQIADFNSSGSGDIADMIGIPGGGGDSGIGGLASTATSLLPKSLTGAASGALAGVGHALGLGGASGILGLGSATIPVIGGVVAGGILASKLIGRGRKAANELTGPGGIQREFEDALRQIDAAPGLTDQQRRSAKLGEYNTLVQLGLQQAGKGKNQRKTVKQMFDTISPLFGQRNPLG